MSVKTDELHRLVDELPEARRAEAKRLLESLIPDDVAKDEDDTVEMRAHRLMLARGIILESGSEEPWSEEDDFEPIEIRGEPLSKTVIDERR